MINGKASKNHIKNKVWYTGFFRLTSGGQSVQVSFTGMLLFRITWVSSARHSSTRASIGYVNVSVLYVLANVQ